MKLNRVEKRINKAKARLVRTHEKYCGEAAELTGEYFPYLPLYRKEPYPYEIQYVQCVFCSLVCTVKETGIYMGETWVINSALKLSNTHPSGTCQGEACTLHRPTNHHMIWWGLHYRNDRAIFERICQHGIGHPDPDTLLSGDDDGHGCDGCCAPPS